MALGLTAYASEFRHQQHATIGSRPLIDVSLVLLRRDGLQGFCAVKTGSKLNLPDICLISTRKVFATLSRLRICSPVLSSAGLSRLQLAPLWQDIEW